MSSRNSIDLLEHMDFFKHSRRCNEPLHLDRRIGLESYRSPGKKVSFRETSDAVKTRGEEIFLFSFTMSVFLVVS